MKEEKQLRKFVRGREVKRAQIGQATYKESLKIPLFSDF